jgi:putative molybdopterin biosynthesis protein
MNQTATPKPLVESLAEKFLTTKEVAALLHVKERKIYDLAAAGEIPGTRALGKWLFERAAIDAWLGQHGNGADVVLKAPPNVILGSHDPLLEWAVRESGSGLAMYLDGSMDGLERFGAGEGIVAGLHVRDAATGDWNVPAVRETVPSAAAVLVEWAWRERGLVVAEGNPLGLKGVADLKGKRLTTRQEGAGAQVLLTDLLSEAGIDTMGVKSLPPSRTENDTALAVLEGEADAAFGLHCLARQFRLDFVPVIRERFDLLVSWREWFQPPMQRLIAFTRTPEFAKKASSLAGYDVSGLGTVHHNGDVII